MVAKLRCYLLEGVIVVFTAELVPDLVGERTGVLDAAGGFDDSNSGSTGTLDFSASITLLSNSGVIGTT